MIHFVNIRYLVYSIFIPDVVNYVSSRSRIFVSVLPLPLQSVQTHQERKHCSELRSEHRPELSILRCPSPRLWLRCHLVRDGVITPGLRVTLPATRGIWEIFHDSKQLTSPLRYSPFLLCILTCGNNQSYLFVKTQPNDLRDKFVKQS